MTEAQQKEVERIREILAASCSPELFEALNAELVRFYEELV
jgi:hypothetical protein